MEIYRNYRTVLEYGFVSVTKVAVYFSCGMLSVFDFNWLDTQYHTEPL